MILFIQRYFHPLMWTLLVLLGLSLGQLAASSLGLWLTAQKPAVRAAEPEAAGIVGDRRALGDYEVIVERNIFDPSARGSASLKEQSPAPAQQTSAPQPVEAPKNIELLGTVAGGSDPLAMLRIDGKVELVRIGDELAGGVTVEYIDRLVVQLRHRDGSLSELSLQDGPDAQAQTVSSRAPQRGPQSDYQVRALEGNRWVIPSSAAERARSNLGELLKSAHMVPNVVNGRTDGFMVRMIRPNSLLAQLGLKVGDVVKEVNGVELSSPEKALQIFTQLRDARNISIGLVRKGEQLSFDYAVD